MYRDGEHAGPYTPYLVDSVGWIVRNDKTCVIVANWHALSSGDLSEHYECGLTIPRGMVRKVRRLSA